MLLSSAPKADIVSLLGSETFLLQVASAGPSTAARTSIQPVCLPLDLPERREEQSTDIHPPSFLSKLPMAEQNQKAGGKMPWRT